eukprot:CAMPEP_0113312286 /NCGR_PEP_ID=MMETSP0010_2-20120614/9174_1 /TAXON_ID=216773 ORGANISM="Corethron hystrix, Strain 308" /NCGR_SAMPLE_ID=MMETSP0010_2 /ASSEMBLY_ACC=CAM_ASM_000155 /LENGTH=429 /DNA_ID=CAMNT_0000168075 /DNA_START=304 /DNA_END=1593 /DNA_ORIENTATION=+ /assembly_acc=CAM_ASM_000155
MIEIISSSGSDKYQGVKSKTVENLIMISRHLEMNSYSNEKTETHTESLVGILSVDKYYASFFEGESSLLEEAVTLIQENQYIAFFQSCGPSFIRSIRRSINVVAIFDYESSQRTTNTTDFFKLQENVMLQPGPDIENEKKKFKDVRESKLRITIRATGMGKAMQGSMTPTNLGDYIDVMKTVYKGAQHPDTGLVKGIEVVSFINNPSFQLASNFHLQMDITMCYDDNDRSNEVTCGTEDEVLREQIYVHPMVRKFNTFENAEHVVRIESMVRKRLVTIELFQQCINRLLQLPMNTRNSKLKNHKCVIDSAVRCSERTVQQLLEDLVGDSGGSGEEKYLYSRELSRVRTYIYGYFEPCIIDLSEDMYNIPEGTFQVKHWSTLDNCKEVSCTFEDAHWNGNTCVPSSTISAFINDLNKRLTSEMFCMPKLL